MGGGGSDRERNGVFLEKGDGVCVSFRERRLGALGNSFPGAGSMLGRHSDQPPVRAIGRSFSVLFSATFT